MESKEDAVFVQIFLENNDHKYLNTILFLFMENLTKIF